MNDWKRFSRRDCPICNGARNDCRANLISNLIHCRDTEANPPDYTFRGLDALGFGMWADRVEADAWAEEKRCEWQEERRRDREIQETQRRQQLLAEADRDREIRNILAQLTLTDLHRQALQSRGLTDADIEAGMYRSVVPWQKLINPVSDRLAGIQKGGKRLHIHASGILCPIANHRGEFIGWQVRLDEAQDGAKYLWAASESKRRSEISVHLPNGELPLAFFEPGSIPREQRSKGAGEQETTADPTSQIDLNEAKQGEKPKSQIPNPKSTEIHLALADAFPGKILVALTEGVSFKPAITAQRLGIHTIGASGGNFASSKETLTKYLNAIKIEAGTEIVPILFADAGSTNNNSVMLAYSRTAEVFKSMGCNLHVAWWGQTSKEDGDIDEVNDETLSNLRLLPYQDFLSFVKKNQHQQEVEKTQQRLRNLTYAPDLLLEKRYLPDLVGQIPLQGIVALKSPKGTGKSVQIQHLIAHLRSLGIKVISITPRRALGREQALKWDIDWGGDAEAPGIHRLTLLENLETVGLCWDSLWKLMERDWSQTLVVIDESELAIAHLLLSATCKEKRPHILRTLEQKIQESLENGGMLLVADADMTDLSVDYFRALAPNAPTFVVVNQYGGEEIRWRVEYHTGKKDVAVTKLMEALSLPVTEADGSAMLTNYGVERQRRIAIPTDSQDQAESLERYIQEQHPQLLTIRIDSTTTETDAGREFVEKPNEKIRELRPDVLIYTPSMGAGVSIDIPWFDEVHAFFVGVIEPSQSRQMLGRIRTPVPRYIWCRKVGRLEGCTSFFPSEIKSRLFAFHRDTNILIDVMQAIAGENATDAAIFQAYETIWNPEIKAWDNPHLDLYAKLVARRNYGLYYLASVLRRELLEEGHILIDCDENFTSSDGQRVKEIKQELPVEEATAIAKAEDISLEMAQFLKQRPSTTNEQRHQIAKALLKAELPGVELTPEFVYKAVTENRRKWLNAQKLFWYMQNPDKVLILDRREWVNHLWQYANGSVFLPDIRTYSLQVKVIRDMQLFEVIDLCQPEKEYSLDDAAIASLIERARKQTTQIYTAMNLRVTQKTTPIKFINGILARVGLNLKFSRQTHDGKRFYQLDSALLYDSDRLAVLEALTRKWAEIGVEADIMSASDPKFHPQQETPICITSGTSCDAQIPLVSEVEPPNLIEPSPVNKKAIATVPELLRPYILEMCHRLYQGACESVQAFQAAISFVKKVLCVMPEQVAAMTITWLRLSLSDWVKAELRRSFPGELTEIIT